MQDFWNDRYDNEEYAYGTTPNKFFKSIIDDLPPGTLLVPGAGEGKDAVYAAELGWKVDAFDFSLKGKEKALQLAESKHVNIWFDVLDATEYTCLENSYDAIALIFFHLPEELRQTFHSKLIKCLKPNGVLILEAFNPKQLSNTSGGPKEVSMLMTKNILVKEFKGLNIELNEEFETMADYGLFHQGKADVIRFLGRK